MIMVVWETFWKKFYTRETIFLTTFYLQKTADLTPDTMSAWKNAFSY